MHTSTHYNCLYNNRCVCAWSHLCFSQWFGALNVLNPCEYIIGIGAAKHKDDEMQQMQFSPMLFLVGRQDVFICTHRRQILFPKIIFSGLFHMISLY